MYMEAHYSVGEIVHRTIVLCFSDSFVQKTSQQSDRSCKIPHDTQFFRRFFEKTFFSSANTHQIYIVSEKIFSAQHQDKVCFLPNCRYHLLLKGDIEDLLQKVDAFCREYQDVGWLYTILKYRFIDKFVVKSGQLFVIR